jgi:hypothetical protein
MGDTSAHRHRGARSVALPLLFIGGVACWFLIASPPLGRMFRELQTCPAAEIKEVRIYDFDSIYSGGSPFLVLRDAKAAWFIGLISKAVKESPNHPQGGSTLFAEVDTTRWGTRHLRISATDNCGVLIHIDSKRVGDGGGWSGGTWRNDDLIRIFEDYAAEKRRLRKSK